MPTRTLVFSFSVPRFPALFAQHSPLLPERRMGLFYIHDIASPVVQLSASLCARRITDRIHPKFFDENLEAMQSPHRCKSPLPAYRPRAPADCGPNADALIADNRPPNRHNTFGLHTRQTPSAGYIPKRRLRPKTDLCRGHPVFYILPEKRYFCCP